MSSSAFIPRFVATTAGVRVVFGPGSLGKVAKEVSETLGCKCAVVLATAEQREVADRLSEQLGSLSVGVLASAVMHTPVEVTESALREISELNTDCLVPIGGGSTTGLSKAIAYRTGLPQVVIPTTYAGSEATPILGQTENGVKTTLKDAKVQPEVIVYDPELLVSLPLGLTVCSALNAIAHAAEALYAQDRNPLSTMLALEGVRAFRHSLPKVIANPKDIEARGESLYGAWLCGTVLGQVGMALHHKLCHTLGGSLNLPHAQTHAIILPHAVAFNFAAVPELLAPLAAIFGVDNPGTALYEFAKQLDAPVALRELGVSEDDLDKVAELATKNPYWNPQEFTRDSIRALLQNAWAGNPPN